MVEPASQAVEPELEAVEAVPALRANDGRFQAGASGNPAGTHVTKGIVDYIKSRTSNYTDLLEILLKVTFGEKLPETDGKPWTYTMKDRLECLNSLLDRAIGKPTQTIIDSGEGVSKELLSTFQKILKGQGAGATTDAPLAPDDKELTPIEAMKRRALPEARTEEPSGG